MKNFAMINVIDHIKYHEVSTIQATLFYFALTDLHPYMDIFITPLKV